MKKTIAIITSDPNSINYEILKKSFFFFKKKNKINYLLIGSKKLFFKKTKANNKLFDIVDVKWEGEKRGKEYFKKCINEFIKLFQKKKVHGLINLPLDKKQFLGKSFPGVTEYISQKLNCLGNETMLLYNSSFSVSPLTTHLKIKNINKNITKKKLLINFENIFNFYQKIIKINKIKIGILGFNPHNGKDFDETTEEKLIINPTINILKKKYRNNIFGPISPDISFVEREKKKINCLIGMYHDQVLTTFKFINKFSAINITLGLPFIRVSPDHGIGKDIIGKNIADPKSLLCCLNFFEKHNKSI